MNEILKGKTAAFLGDSICMASTFDKEHQWWGWAGRIDRDYGFASYVNKGCDGASVSDCRKQNRVIFQLERIKDQNFDSLSILNNNALVAEDYIITGTRGWFSDPSSQITAQPTDYQKIINREAIRLRLALSAAAKLREETNKEIIAFFHFPPLWNDFCDENTFDALVEFGVKRCYFGHIHGCYNVPDKYEHRGVNLTMISADFLNFTPKLI